MRCHPFFGIVAAAPADSASQCVVQEEQVASDQVETRVHRRRTFLGQLAGVFAGGLGLFAVRQSAAQQAAVRVPSVPNIPSVPGTPSVVVTPSGPQVVAPGGSARTSGRIRSQGGGTYTTQAIGEEGGTVTTYAVGEEGAGSGPPGGGSPPPGTVTTYAVGEEGGTVPRPPGTVTTQAVGEEGGVTRPRYYYRNTNRGRRYWYRY